VDNKYLELVYELACELDESGLPVRADIQATLLEAGYDLSNWSQS